MLYVDSSTGIIRLTRGDTARFNVTIKNGSSGEYEMQDSDTLTMTVKRKSTDATSLLSKTIQGATQFYIEPADTEGFAFGKYKYDVELRTEAGDVYTIIEPTDFEIMAEVTW